MALLIVTHYTIDGSPGSAGSTNLEIPILAIIAVSSLMAHIYHKFLVHDLVSTGRSKVTTGLTPGAGSLEQTPIL